MILFKFCLQGRTSLHYAASMRYIIRILPNLDLIRLAFYFFFRITLNFVQKILNEKFLFERVFFNIDAQTGYRFDHGTRIRIHISSSMYDYLLQSTYVELIDLQFTLIVLAKGDKSHRATQHLEISTRIHDKYLKFQFKIYF